MLTHSPQGCRKLGPQRGDAGSGYTPSQSPEVLLVLEKQYESGNMTSWQVYHSSGAITLSTPLSECVYEKG